VSSRSRKPSALRAALPPRGVFGQGDGRLPAADALCRAPPGKSTRPASTAASSKDDVVGKPERLASGSSPLRTLSRGVEGHRKPTPAISTIHEHDRDLLSPVRQLRGCPQKPLPWVACLLRGASCEAWPAELPLIRSPRRLSPPERPPDAIARSEVGYPDPGDPDTFCRRRVARGAGGATLAGGLRLLLRAHRASSLARNPPPGASLSQDLPAGPLPVSPREGSHVPRSPRCLPSRAALLRGW